MHKDLNVCQLLIKKQLKLHPLMSVVINLPTRLPLDLRALQNVVRLCQDAGLAQASTVFRT